LVIERRLVVEWGTWRKQQWQSVAGASAADDDPLRCGCGRLGRSLPFRAEILRKGLI